MGKASHSAGTDTEMPSQQEPIARPVMVDDLLLRCTLGCAQSAEHGRKRHDDYCWKFDPQLSFDLGSLSQNYRHENAR